jgi:hypothetical protein
VGGGGNGVAAKLEGAHFKPHSAVWMPGSDGVFVTGGSSIEFSPRTLNTYSRLCICLYRLTLYLRAPIIQRLHKNAKNKAELDDLIKLWDLRNTTSPIASYHGHVPVNGKKLKRIHRPIFLSTAASSSSLPLESFILSGGENSHAISMFQLPPRGDFHVESPLQLVFSRGKLPMDVGDIGSLAVHGRNVAVAAEGGEVLLLSLS